MCVNVFVCVCVCVCDTFTILLTATTNSQITLTALTSCWLCPVLDCQLRSCSLSSLTVAYWVECHNLQCHQLTYVLALVVYKVVYAAAYELDSRMMTTVELCSWHEMVLWDWMWYTRNGHGHLYRIQNTNNTWRFRRIANISGCFKYNFKCMVGIFHINGSLCAGL